MTGRARFVSSGPLDRGWEAEVAPADRDRVRLRIGFCTEMAQYQRVRTPKELAAPSPHACDEPHYMIRRNDAEQFYTLHFLYAPYVDLSLSRLSALVGTEPTFVPPSDIHVRYDEEAHALALTLRIQFSTRPMPVITHAIVHYETYHVPAPVAYQ